MKHMDRILDSNILERRWTWNDNLHIVYKLGFWIAVIVTAVSIEDLECQYGCGTILIKYNDLLYLICVVLNIDLC